VEQNSVLEDDRLFILSKQNAIFSTHNNLISVGMFQQGIIGAIGTIEISPTQFEIPRPLLLVSDQQGAGHEVKEREGTKDLSSLLPRVGILSDNLSSPL